MVSKMKNTTTGGSNMGQLGFFDIEKKLQALSELGDPLERLAQAIDWQQFKPVIAKAFRKARKSNAGRPPFDYVMMFKIMVLQHMYNLSDAQTQFQLIDRFSFRRFIGVGAEDTIPDEKTIWLFRETITRTGAVKKLFALFGRFLDNAGYQAKKGMVVDASIVEVPRQRNTVEENRQIKDGEVPAEWEKRVAKLRQKDVDARWTKKGNEMHYGYKDHINVDVKHKLIRKYEVTSAHVHDSQELEALFDPTNTRQAMWGDSAYSSQEIRDILKERGIKDHIHRKGYRDHSLTAFQKAMNKKKSSIRARVEHIFGRISFLIGRWIRCIGVKRAQARIGLTNLVYNMNRFTYLVNHA
jgi:transposase, IS5 family